MFNILKIQTQMKLKMMKILIKLRKNCYKKNFLYSNRKYKNYSFNYKVFVKLLQNYRVK